MDVKCKFCLYPSTDHTSGCLLTCQHQPNFIEHLSYKKIFPEEEEKLQGANMMGESIFPVEKPSHLPLFSLFPSLIFPFTQAKSLLFFIESQNRTWYFKQEKYVTTGWTNISAATFLEQIEITILRFQCPFSKSIVSSISVTFIYGKIIKVFTSFIWYTGCV